MLLILLPHDRYLQHQLDGGWMPRHLLDLTNEYGQTFIRWDFHRRATDKQEAGKPGELVETSPPEPCVSCVRLEAPASPFGQGHGLKSLRQ